MNRRLFFLVALAFSLGTGGNAWACASCFGAAEGPMIDAARVGVWLLLGITGAVQGGLVAFFIYLRKRAKQAAAQQIQDEWYELQRSGTPWRSA